MTGPTIRQALLGRLPRRGDDRGSLPMLFLVILATVALSTLLLTSVLSQSQATRFTQSRVHALHAAQTGLDFAIGQIRNALSSGGVGDDGKLECGPWTGAADNDGTGSYAAVLTYYVSNPAGRNVRPMSCTASGPFDQASTSRTPRYAVISAKGTDSPAGVDGTENYDPQHPKDWCTTERAAGTSCRILTATYVFQTNDANIVGGQIRIYPAGATQYCMDAGTNPGPNTPVLLQTCSTSNPPIEQQVWAYRADLSIELVSSAPTSTPLCIDTSPQPHKNLPAIVLKKCSVPDASVCPAGSTPSSFAATYPGRTCSISSWNQQWSVDDSAHLQGAKTDQSDLDGYCIEVASQTAGTALTLDNCAGSTTDTKQTWVPSPTAGAGMAGAGNHQLVNYGQFAMCLDITNQNVGSSFEILYTCKQNPDPTKVAWNQKFWPAPALGAGPTKTLLQVKQGSTTYCLKSPGIRGGYPVLVTPCPSSVSFAPAGFVWTVDQKYTDATQTVELGYADKYTVKDDAGQCLGVGDNADLFISVYYKAVVTTCDGTAVQKWNADPSLDAATIKDIHEI